MDSVLRPRDIQARIRSGESPEAVAAAAQTSVDRIMGFATPVLAERAYVAEQALKASVRRRAGDGPIGHLGQAVEQRLATRDVDAQDVEWDSWRREDGRWTLVAAYPSGSGVSGTTQARFVYDVAGRYVMADDEEARWLVGERSGTQAGGGHVTVTDETVVETVFQPVEEDAGVPERVDAPAASGPAEPQEPTDAGHDPEQLPLGDDAIGVVTGLRTTPQPPRSDDWMVTQASDRATPPRRVVEEPAETLFDTPPEAEPAPEVPAPDEPLPEEQAPEGRAEEPTLDEPPVEPDPRTAKAEKPRRSAKSKRASVPSWDEIMFGSGKGE
jgi:hypothetical protein